MERMTITEFILARVAEDEEEIQNARISEGPEWWMPEHWTRERSQAECEVFRRIVEWHTKYEGYDEAECCEERWGPIQLQAPRDRELSAGVTSSGGLSMRESFATQEYIGCVTLMMLAAIWSDHADYREEWRL